MILATRCSAPLERWFHVMLAFVEGMHPQAGSRGTETAALLADKGAVFSSLGVKGRTALQTRLKGVMKQWLMCL